MSLLMATIVTLAGLGAIYFAFEIAADKSSVMTWRDKAPFIFAEVLMAMLAFVFAAVLAGLI